MNTQRGIDYLRGTVTLLRAKGNNEEARWLAQVVELVQQSDMTARSVEEIWQILATHGFRYKESSKLSDAIIDVAGRAAKNTQANIYAYDLRVKFDKILALLHDQPAREAAKQSVSLDDLKMRLDLKAEVNRVNKLMEEREGLITHLSDTQERLLQDTKDLQEQLLAVQRSVKAGDALAENYRQRLTEWPKLQTRGGVSSAVTQQDWDDAAKEIRGLQKMNRDLACAVRQFFEIVDNNMITSGERCAAEDRVRSLAGCPARRH